MEAKRALTIGEIAKRLKCPIHKVEYLVSSRNIKPIQRAGNLRVFSEDALETIRRELERNGNKVPCAT